MADKLNYTSESLLNLKFTKDVRGYDPLEVDETLDKVIEDLRVYEKYKKNTDEYIRKIEREIYDLNQKINALEIENAKYSKSLENIGDNPAASKENIQLLKRISALEDALYKLGGNPSKIK